jgi:hypothetical protein
MNTMQPKEDYTMHLLIQYLTRIAPGAIADTRVLDDILADKWDRFNGSSENYMAAHKLLGRMEDADWRPPILSFSVERHSVENPTQAPVERWVVDLLCNTARISGVTTRKLFHLGLDLSIETAAEEIVRSILSGEPDERLLRKPDGILCIAATWVFYKGSGLNRTVGVKRRTLCDLIEVEVKDHGWMRMGLHLFKKHAAKKVHHRHGVLSQMTEPTRKRILREKSSPIFRLPEA